MPSLAHTITIALAAMISAVNPAQATPAMYRWVDETNTATPRASFVMDHQRTRTLADFNGKVVLLNLWATWCTPCLKELPTLDALEKTYANQGLVVLALSLDRFSYEELRAFTRKVNVALPHLAQDATGKFHAALAPQGLPTSFLIDRRGVIIARFSGSTDWMRPDARTRIEAALK